MKEGDLLRADDPVVLRNPHLFISDRATTAERQFAKANVISEPTPEEWEQINQASRVSTGVPGAKVATQFGWPI